MTRLEQLRVDALLSPEALGEVAGVSGGAIRRIEEGRSPHMETLRKLSEHFAIPPSELLGGPIRVDNAA